MNGQAASTLRGTNRVAEMCRAAGIAEPLFQEIGPFAVVTFRVRVGTTAQVTPQVVPHVAPQVAPQVAAALQGAAQGAKSREELQRAAEIKDREHFRKAYLERLLSSGWLERTIPDKPRSRMQRYRTTKAGLAVLKTKGRTT